VNDINKNVIINIVLHISGDRRNICIYRGSSDVFTPLHPHQIVHVTNSSFISALFPGDFNADGRLDILVSLQKGNSLLLDF